MWNLTFTNLNLLTARRHTHTNINTLAQSIVSALLGVAASSSSTPPVPVLACTEALCPGCEAFITDDLFPAFEAVGNIMNLTFVPYGNAQIDMDAKTVTCQHGDTEVRSHGTTPTLLTYSPLNTSIVDRAVLGQHLRAVRHLQEPRHRRPPALCELPRVQGLRSAQAQLNL